MNEEDLKFYNMQDKEELVWMCISRDNRIKSLQQRIDKAIEYIENNLQSFLYSIEYKTLLEILKGGNKWLKKN